MGRKARGSTGAGADEHQTTERNGVQDDHEAAARGQRRRARKLLALRVPAAGPQGTAAGTPKTVSKAAGTADFIKTLPGISAPFDKDFFDPLGLRKSASIKDVRRWREAELTHGRVAMLAALGFVVGEQLEDFPLFLNFDGNITGPAIGHYQQLGQGFWEPLLIAIGICESYRVAVGWVTPKSTGFNSLKEDYIPGDLGFVPAELKSPGTEVFEHLFQILDYDIVKEVDLVEDIVGLPETPLPELDSTTLSNLGFN